MAWTRVFVVAALLASACGDGHKKPSVLLVVLDSLRADHVSQYGYRLATTPGMELLANSSTRMEQAFSLASFTRPSVASIFTGLEPTNHAVQLPSSRLGEGVATWAELLAKAGYRTAGVSFNVNVSAHSGLDRGFAPMHFDATKNTLAYHDVQRMLDWSKAWIDAERDKPFFLYLHPMNIHGPYRVPPLARSALLGRAPQPGFVYYGKRMRGILRGKTSLRSAVDANMRKSLLEQYDTAIRYTTDRVGAFFDWLNSTGRFDDTLIIVTADHGEELFEHGGFSHGYSLYDEVLHVPLWVKLPGQRQARVVKTRVQLTDLLPTTLDVLDLPALAGIDGRSFTTALGDPTTEVPLRAHERYSGAWPTRCVAEAVVRWPYKAISTSLSYDGTFDTLQLFDLSQDPRELRDLATREAAIAGDLSNLMPPRQLYCAVDETSDPDEEENTEATEQLRALGYVQ